MAVRVTQIRSVIGTKRPHRGTLRALGLHGIGTTHVHEDSPTFRGMVHSVQYLVSVEEDITSEAAAPADGKG
jgi:large subunit ribosomal protein L30